MAQAVVGIPNSSPLTLHNPPSPDEGIRRQTTATGGNTRQMAEYIYISMVNCNGVQLGFFEGDDIFAHVAPVRLVWMTCFTACGSRPLGLASNDTSADCIIYYYFCSRFADRRMTLGHKTEDL